MNQRNPISGDVDLHKIAFYQCVGVSITKKTLCVHSIFVTPVKMKLCIFGLNAHIYDKFHVYMHVFNERKQILNYLSYLIAVLIAFFGLINVVNV